MAFVADVGRRPSKRFTLDRYPDNNGNYEPGNVRWATTAQQTRNMRTNHRIEFNGQSRCLIEWSEITGIPRHVISLRLNRFGWSVEKALTQPVARRAQRR